MKNIFTFLLIFAGALTLTACDDMFGSETKVTSGGGPLTYNNIIVDAGDDVNIDDSEDIDNDNSVDNAPPVE